MQAFRVLEERVGILTGGSRGIGESIARNLTNKGCSLVLVYNSSSSKGQTEQLASSLSSNHSVRCIAVQANLSDPENAVETIMSAAKETYTDKTTGRFQIDVLVNNAGVSRDRHLNDPNEGPIDREHFRKTYTVNVLAPLLLTQACAPYLPKDRTGRIINISSVSSAFGFVGQSVYGSSKAALEAMTRTWARELADRATVNAVNPGPVIGDMYFEAGEDFWRQMQAFQETMPFSVLRDEDARLLGQDQVKIIKEKMNGRRPAFPHEVAGIVGMLCTEDGRWCTGSLVSANGGMRMGM